MGYVKRFLLPEPVRCGAFYADPRGDEPDPYPCEVCGDYRDACTCDVTCPDCEGAGDHEVDSAGSLYGVACYPCDTCRGTGTIPAEVAA